MAAQGYRGGLVDIRESDEEIRFLIGRMGTIHEVVYVRGNSEAKVVRKVFPFNAMLTWMHKTFGVDHEYALHNVWGWLMLLTSIGLLGLGASGIYLWFKIYHERLVGSILLFGNLLFGIGMILLISIA